MTRGAGAAHLDVVIPGVQKAGTSSLIDALGSHSGVSRHPAGEFPALVRDDLDLDQAVQDTYSDAEGLCLAKSAGVLHADGALSGLRRHNPDTRLVVMLRDPVARMHSAYWFARRTGDETLPTFDEALDREGDRDDVPSQRRAWVRYRERSRYLEPLRKCVELFGRDRVTILVLENYAKDRERTLAELQHWLGLATEDLTNRQAVRNSAMTAGSARVARLARGNGRVARVGRAVLPAPLGRRLRRGIVRMNEKPMTVPPLDDDLQRRLADSFAEEKVQLAAEFSLDLSNWS